MRTTEMVLFAHFLKTSKFIPACISIYILSLVMIHLVYSPALPSTARMYARKVISEVYTSFVLQCTVSGRQCKSLTWDPSFT